MSPIYPAGGRFFFGEKSAEPGDDFVAMRAEMRADARTELESLAGGIVGRARALAAGRPPALELLAAPEGAWTPDTDMEDS